MTTDNDHEYFGVSLICPTTFAFRYSLEFHSNTHFEFFHRQTDRPTLKGRHRSSFPELKNKSDNSPNERARKLTNLHITQMSHGTTQVSHGVTNPFTGAFRYRDTLNNDPSEIPFYKSKTNYKGD